MKIKLKFEIEEEIADEILQIANHRMIPLDMLVEFIFRQYVSIQKEFNNRFEKWQ